MLDRSNLKVGMGQWSLMLAAALAAGSAVGQNLIVNASFEDQFVELFQDVAGAQGWSAFDASFTTRYLARTGDQSFKTYSLFVGAASGIYQEFPAAAGEVYSASVWAANPSFDALGADQAGFLNVEWRNAGGLISFDSVRVVSGHLTPFDTYTQATLQATAPAGATTARLVLLTGAFFDANGDGATTGGGAVYFDDASLTLGTIDPKWITDGNGNWEDAANWQGGVPDAAGAPANFVTQLSSPAAVTLQSGKTVGSMTFDSGTGYTIQGAEISMQNGSDMAVIDVVRGFHRINSDVSAAGGLVVRGSDGVTLGGRLRVSGGLEANGGELAFVGGTAVVGDLEVNSGSVSLNSTSMVVDYMGTSPIALLVGYLAGGLISVNGDDGFGLPTYLAIAEAADLGLTEFDGISLDETAVVMKYTYVGDANLDGQVDALDYERVDLAIGNSGVFGVAQGDLNYDGAVDALDYEQIDLNIGNGVGSPLAGIEGGRFIPEPSSLGLVLGGGLLGLRRRR